MNVEPPICAVCGRPVDKFERRDAADGWSVEFVAYCHGRRQSVRLSQADLGRAGLNGITMGRAFESKEALPPITVSDTVHPLYDAQLAARTMKGRTLLDQLVASLKQPNTETHNDR